MEAWHALADFYLYAALKAPMYGYESIDEVKESLPYYRVAWIIRVAQIRRLFT